MAVSKYSRQKFYTFWHDINANSQLARRHSKQHMYNIQHEVVKYHPLLDILLVALRIVYFSSNPCCWLCNVTQCVRQHVRQPEHRNVRKITTYAVNS